MFFKITPVFAFKFVFSVCFKPAPTVSPVAYLADKAASWGDMPLHAWLSTVIKDPSALSQMEELLGIGMARNVTPNIDE